MSIRLRHLKLQVATVSGPFGAELSFKQGLNVIRADNSSGKSTCMKAIVYALGLERMFGPGNQPPLAPAMMALIEDDEQETRVIESSVYLELENHEGRIVTVHRKVVGTGERDWRLITVWEGAALSNPGQYPSRELYARDPGAATREDGFHTFLEKFFGWSMPEVVRFNGDIVPLYMEAVLPLLYVEQKFGWAAIQATTPKYFQIREVEKRAIEFILNLDAYKRELEKQKLAQDIADLDEKWSDLASQCDLMAATEGASIRSLPKHPTVEWPPQVAPYVECYSGSRTLSLNSSITEDKAELVRLENEAIPAAEQVSAELTTKLRKLREALDENEVIASDAAADLEFDGGEMRSIDARLDAIADDLHKNQDILRLRRYGASPDQHLARGSCPTCHQSVTDSLLSQTLEQQVMTVEENVEYLNSQRRTFEDMKEKIERALQGKRLRLEALEKRSSDLRSEMRTAKQTLVSDGRAPSAVAIRQRVVLEERIDKLTRLSERFSAKVAGFAELSARWGELQAQKMELSGDNLTATDKKKLARLQALLIKMESEFGFDSFPPDNLAISSQNYLPNRAGFDLVYDVSASDNIRTTAAYLLALLEISREFPTNHLGLLILDEPRQQSLSWNTFKQVFERAKSSGGADQQVIIATSEEQARIDYLGNDPEIHFINFSGKVIRRITAQTSEL